MFNKIFKKIAVIFVIMALGGLGGILADRYFFPYLSTFDFFARYSFFKKANENVTVINKTEQVVVKEEASIEKISNRAAASVVNIIAYAQKSGGGEIALPQNLTGTIVTSDGLIMAYAPEIKTENTAFKILRDNGNIHEIQFAGADSYSNLIFFKAPLNNLPAIAFGNSDDVRSGSKVVVIGNSGEIYANRFAGGLISGFDPGFNLSGKTLSSSEKLEGVFFTDFNAGSFTPGGPAIDYAGQTIGIAGSILKDGKTVYFLIPSNKIKRVLEKAIAAEFSLAPSLGIYYIPLNKSYALAHGISSETGAYIYSPSGQTGLAVIAGSPAQKAGLRLGDIIRTANGQEINSENSFSDILYRLKKGDSVELDILRDQKEIKVKVNL